MVINKSKCRKALEYLKNMDFQLWQGYTRHMGDKDMWHLAWVFTNTNLGFIPFYGLIFSEKISIKKKNKEPFAFVTQIKYDMNERPLVKCFYVLCFVPFFLTFVKFYQNRNKKRNETDFW